MTKYFVEVELRSLFRVEINADTQANAMNIAMEKPELWATLKPVDQTYGVRSVIEDISEEEKNNE
jgi:hypothetical protein